MRVFSWCQQHTGWVVVAVFFVVFGSLSYLLPGITTAGRMSATAREEARTPAPSAQPTIVATAAERARVLQEQAAEVNKGVRMEENLKTMSAMLTELKGQGQTAKVEREQAARKIEELERQLRAAQTEKAGRERETQKPRDATPPRPPVRPAAALPPAVPPGPRAALRLLKNDGKDSLPVPPPPALTQDPPAYLGTGCRAKAHVVTGVMATSRVGSALPMLVSLVEPFHCPAHLQGPERDPLPTLVPLQGCVVLARAAGDLATGRVYTGDASGTPSRLSCVLPNTRFSLDTIHAYITDMDGTYGVVGQVFRHNSSAETKAFVTAMLGEMSAFLGYARARVLITVPGGGAPPGTGIQTGIQQMTAFYLQQMADLLPTLWVQSATPVYVIIEEGTALPGLPTSVVMQGGMRS
jgi:hypothetical protein